MTHLSTFKEVFDELGGVPGLVDLTGANAKAVGAWQTHKRFPWKAFPAVSGALLARGKVTPMDIWGLKGKEKVS